MPSITNPQRFSEDHQPSVTTFNNNELYEKLRPLEDSKLPEHQAHGDDTRTQSVNDLEKPFQLSVYEDELKAPIPPMSSSSNEFSLEMAMRITDTSNEALKTDDENGMTKTYFLSEYHQREKEIVFSDVSLQRQLPRNECDYEIDLGNGFITKSSSSYPNQLRTASVLSADSIQPITTFKMPFTNAVYNAQIRPKETIRTDEPKVSLNSQRRWPNFSFGTVTRFSIGTTIILFLIVTLFFVL